MAEDAKGFKVWNVQMREIPSGKKGGDGTAESGQKGVASASVECLKCGKTWTATEGPEAKSLTNALGSIVITCPNCNQTGAVQPSEFQ